MSAEMILFSGFKRVASIKKNRFDLLAAEANKRLIENNLELDVTTCYFQILLII
jgi:outer membrane protein